METETQTIADFLLARIAEDESAASVLGAPLYYTETRRGRDVMVPAGYRLDAEGQRLLAECEAKRQIVGIHSRATSYEGGGYCGVCDQMEATEGAWSGRGELYPCATLLALAQPYADHLDFREEWRA